ncbi:MAG: transglycosylase family protein [Acidimicrobiales bacterium]
MRLARNSVLVAALAGLAFTIGIAAPWVTPPPDTHHAATEPDPTTTTVPAAKPNTGWPHAWPSAAELRAEAYLAALHHATTTTTTTAPPPVSPPSTVGDLPPRDAPRTSSTHIDAPVDHGVWDRIADCESGDHRVPGSARWDIDTGNGHYGGLQWTLQTWNDVRPPGAPDNPAHATRDQQIAAAETLMTRPWGGFHHWPGCSTLLGLR